MRWRSVFCGLVFVFAFGFTWSSRASAYPWMIQHGYQQCQGCHVDPSGAGILTGYGRATSEVVLSMPWGAPTDDPSGAHEFLWGAIEVPEPLLLGGDVRVLELVQKISNVPRRSQFIYMQLDFEAALVLSRFVASGSIGYAPEGALGAALTRGDEQNLVSRQHWLGYRLDPERLLLKAGRMNLPFGIRNVEHTLWTRAYTRTNINDQQQYGVALSVETPEVRGELMGLVGNLQLRPDEFRERGYAGYVEFPVAEKFALGGSSLITHRQLDTRLLTKAFRHAHGAFARWGTPYGPLVLLTEWNYVLEAPRAGRWRSGIVGYVQADFEATQGVHVLLTAEAHKVGVEDATPFSFATWLSYAWFFAPHADLRFDAVHQRIGAAGPDTEVFACLIQGHISL